MTWQRPRSTHGELAGYKVSYSQQGSEDVLEKRLKGEQYHLTTQFLGKWEKKGIFIGPQYFNLFHSAIYYANSFPLLVLRRQKHSFLNFKTVLTLWVKHQSL